MRSVPGGEGVGEDGRKSGRDGWSGNRMPWGHCFNLSKWTISASLDVLDTVRCVTDPSHNPVWARPWAVQFLGLTPRHYWGV